MTEGNRRCGWAAIGALFVTASITGTAAAQECASDAECGAGYVCHLYTGSICSAGCRRGETCPPPVCETRTQGLCENAPCEADADCPDPMVCYAEQVEECEDYACSDESPCNVPPPSCREYTVTSCRQPYELPCQADADCGPGFRCQEEVLAWCSGSASRDPSDGGVATPPPEPECGEERTGQYYCALQPLPCGADADCPSGFACVPQPTATCDSGAVTKRPASAVPGDDPAVPAGMAPTCAPPTPAQSFCQPARWSQNRGSSSGGKDAGVATGKGDDEEESGEDTAEGPDSDDSSASSDERPRRRHGGSLRRWLHIGHGCSLTGRADSSGVDLALLLVLGSMATVAFRRRL